MVRQVKQNCDMARLPNSLKTMLFAFFPPSFCGRNNPAAPISRANGCKAKAQSANHAHDSIQSRPSSLPSSKVGFGRVSLSPRRVRRFHPCL